MGVTKIHCRSFRLILIIFIMGLQTGDMLLAQSIRKDYREMTDRERLDLVNAFYAMRNGPDLINNLRLFHNNFGSQLHFQLPNNPSNDSFLAWHRRMVFELEQEMQKLNPKVSIPYWNSIEDQGANSPLWSQDFLGQFNQDWSLNRNFGDLSLLPNANDFNSTFALANWLEFSNTLERGKVHAGAHRWVGGLMPTHSSPGDPVFYLHHAFVDKIWQDWEEIHHNSSYIRTSLLRYDGTFSFNGQLRPLVNPNDILDSRTLGVFYGENRKAVLDKYQVSNKYRPSEHFYYQYTISAGNNFVVGTSHNAVLESVNEVILEPGFIAESGSSFLALIDQDTETQQMLRYTDGVTRVVKPFTDVDLSNIMDFESGALKIGEMQFYPNPFSDYLHIRLSEPLSFLVTQLIDLNGRIVYQHEGGEKAVQLYKLEHLESLSRGTYVLRISRGKEVLFNTKVVRK